jgi:integrase/recombinase XerD
VAALRVFLRWAFTSGRTGHDLSGVLANVRRPVTVPPRVLSAHEIERTLAAVPVRRPAGLRDRAMLELLYATGIRRGELAGIDVSDVQASVGVLRVRRGKGGTARLVPLSPRAAAWIQRYLDDVRPRHLRDLREPALFVSRRGRRLTPKEITGRMHACWAAAGLPQAGSCHVMRHSVATLMHDRGADIRDLQALLGHAVLTSTQLYTRVSMQRLQEVHRRTHPGSDWSSPPET